MRSLSKDSNIMSAATYIVQALRNRFSKTELQYEKELKKLRKEKAILKLQRKEMDK